MDLRGFPWWLHIVWLPLIASGMGPLVECRMHDFWGLWLPLGLVLEQALILELGVPPLSTRLRNLFAKG